MQEETPPPVPVDVVFSDDKAEVGATSAPIKMTEVNVSLSRQWQTPDM
jgi:hypothetical protein